MEFIIAMLSLYSHTYLNKKNKYKQNVNINIDIATISLVYIIPDLDYSSYSTPEFDASIIKVLYTSSKLNDLHKLIQMETTRTSVIQTFVY